jgi:hypothetical protein
MQCLFDTFYLLEHGTAMGKGDFQDRLRRNNTISKLPGVRTTAKLA